jgi:hypothetical protein
MEREQKACRNQKCHFKSSSEYEMAAASSAAKATRVRKTLQSIWKPNERGQIDGIPTYGNN